MVGLWVPALLIPISIIFFSFLFEHPIYLLGALIQFFIVIKLSGTILNSMSYDMPTTRPNHRIFSSYQVERPLETSVLILDRNYEYLFRDIFVCEELENILQLPVNSVLISVRHLWDVIHKFMCSPIDLARLVYWYGVM